MGERGSMRSEREGNMIGEGYLMRDKKVLNVGVLQTRT